MGTMAEATIDTANRKAFYRGFVIQEVRIDSVTVWEWCQENYDGVSYFATGDCASLFECIDAVNAWHEAHDARQAKEG